MKHVRLPDGVAVPALGLGTWRMGESKARAPTEVDAIRTALALGYRLVDTAEMYGEGGAERLVGQALGDVIRAGDFRREDVFIVSKAYPHHASRRGVVEACRASLKRLQLEHLDLYLLHWRGSYPLEDTVRGFEDLIRAGDIARWGVSNFDVSDLAELAEVAGARNCMTNQVWYSAGQRGVEFDLLPWMRMRGMPLMAYSPIDQSALASDARVMSLAVERGVSAATLALAWVIRRGDVVAIPKASSAEHLRQNLAAAELVLDAEALSAMDHLFPPPTSAEPLAMN